MSYDEKVAARAERILDIVRNMTKDKGWQVKSRIEEIELHCAGYAEPGYDTKTGMVATGNWNTITEYNRTSASVETVSNLPDRLLKLFEKLGIECEWSDEWTNCWECSKLVRTKGDSYSWTPSFVETEDGAVCIECIKQDPVGHLESLEGDDARANTIDDIDPADYGYVKLNENSYQSSWHPGQTDSSSKIAKELEEKGISRFLFNIDAKGQFDTSWSVYVHKDEEELLTEEKTADDE